MSRSAFGSFCETLPLCWSPASPGSAAVGGSFCQSLCQISLQFAVLKTIFNHCFGINENFLGSYSVTTTHHLNFFKAAFQEMS